MGATTMAPGHLMPVIVDHRKSIEKLKITGKACE
jgi:hypothetical protein